MIKRKTPPDYEKIRLRLAGLCARSEQCTSDIRRKALQSGLSRAEVDSIIAFLSDNRFLDDRRFAGAYARDKAALAGWGPYKIRMGLRQKGISEELADEALASVDEETYSNTLAKLVESAARRLDLSDPSDRNRLLRQLAARGFSLSSISRFLDTEEY
ncbi:MAG: RecX family transcriptional regulator [Bacteroidales bacterium]|nr:RecX family transcriptional regulator [Bacteroidales bacterium]